MPRRLIYLSLGSNVGDRESNIRKALEGLAEKLREPVKLSSIYETEPWGYKYQPSFLNICAVYFSSVEPWSLLEKIGEIEQRLERVRTFKWGPRTIDIDILVMDGIEIKDEKLTIPHPRMWDRAFVVVPLAEVAPEIKAPDRMSAGLKALLLDPDHKVKPIGRI